MNGSEASSFECSSCSIPVAFAAENRQQAFFPLQTADRSAKEVWSHFGSTEPLKIESGEVTPGFAKTPGAFRIAPSRYQSYRSFRGSLRLYLAHPELVARHNAGV